MTKMAHSSNTCFSILLVLALTISSHSATDIATFSCIEDPQYLLPCQPFLKATGGVTAACCQGVQALSRATASEPDSKTVVGCIKQAAFSVNIDEDRASQLHQLCKVAIPVSDQPNVDFKKVTPNDARSKSSSYKRMDVANHSPTTPGSSPGMGHKRMDVANHSPTTPGSSPGMGHKRMDVANHSPTTPGNSPGMGHIVKKTYAPPAN